MSVAEPYVDLDFTPVSRSKMTKKVFLSALVALVFALPFAASAAPHVSLYPSVPWQDNNRPCWDEAARYHGVDPWLLYAIAKVESSYQPHLRSRMNRNGTYDFGLMQINSVHLPKLRRYGLDMSALANACASTYVGAWILREAQGRYGNTWKAIAAYNVGSLNTQGRYNTGLKYATKVYAAYREQVGRYGSSVRQATASRPAAVRAPAHSAQAAGAAYGVQVGAPLITLGNP